MSHNIKMFAIISILLLSFLPTPFARPQTTMRPISKKNAKELVLESVKLDYPTASIDPYQDKYDPNFYWFEVSWNNRKGSMIAGHFAVNLFTGKIWLVEGEVCFDIRNISILKIQRNIYHHLKIDKKVFDAVNNKMPSPCSTGNLTGAH